MLYFINAIEYFAFNGDEFEYFFWGGRGLPVYILFLLKTFGNQEISRNLQNHESPEKGSHMVCRTTA